MEKNNLLLSSQNHIKWSLTYWKTIFIFIFTKQQKFKSNAWKNLRCDRFSQNNKNQIKVLKMERRNLSLVSKNHKNWGLIKLHWIDFHKTKKIFFRCNTWKKNNLLLFSENHKKRSLTYGKNIIYIYLHKTTKVEI